MLKTEIATSAIGELEWNEVNLLVAARDKDAVSEVLPIAGGTSLAERTLPNGDIISACLIGVAAIGGGILFSKSRQKGSNFVTESVQEEAQLTGREPCEIISERLSQEKAKPKDERDGELIKAMQQAEKFLGCRNKQKRVNRD